MIEMNDKEVIDQIGSTMGIGKGEKWLVIRDWEEFEHIDV